MTIEIQYHILFEFLSDLAPSWSGPVPEVYFRLRLISREVEVMASDDETKIRPSGRYITDMKDPSHWMDSDGSVGSDSRHRT